MSMAYNFMAVTKEQYHDIESGKLNMFDLREEGIAKEAGFEWLTNHFFDYVLDDSFPLVAIREAEPNELPVDGGVTYYSSNIAQIVKAFNDTDLEKFYIDMYENAEVEIDKSKPVFEDYDFKLLLKIKELFEYAHNHDMFVIGWWC